MKQTPLVSICCLTYNHEKFIKKCLDGFIIQKTNFPVEVLIHDDASKDITAAIIKEYENKYPELILPIYQKENQYSKGVKVNTLFNFSRARGKYIALCEGDDYWTDPYKPQKQVDFLEANPDYVLCSHNGTILDEIGTGNASLKLIDSDTEFDFDTKDLLIKNRAATLTVMFRSWLSQKLPDWYSSFSGGDRSLYLIASKHGKLRHLEFNGAVYRIHHGGITSQRKVRSLKKKREALIIKYEEYIRYYRVLNTYFNYQYDDTIKEFETENYLNLFHLYFANRDFDKAKDLINHKKIRLRNLKKRKSIIKFFLIQYMPLSFFPKGIIKTRPAN